MKARDIMTSSPQCCASTDSIAEVARLMRDNDCGSLPVVDGEKLVGVVTDRDLAIRAVASGKGADTSVSEVMSAHPWCCGVDDDLKAVEKVMSDKQVRRVPIVDAEGCLVGIVAQADLARASAEGERVSDHEVAIVVEAISKPSPGNVERGLNGVQEDRAGA